MKNTRFLKIIPQILLLSVFALSSCGNESVSNNKCLTKLKENLEAYKTELSTKPNWELPQKADDSKLKSLENVDGCSPLSQETQGEQKPQDTTANSLDTIKSKYVESYSDLNSYISLARNYNSTDDQQSKLKNTLKLNETNDVSEGKIKNHAKFIEYSLKKVNEQLTSIDKISGVKPPTSNEDLAKKVADIEKSNIEQNKNIDDIKKDLATLKNAVAANSLFNLLILTSILGCLGYVIFSKTNKNSSNSGTDKKRKSRSGNLGSTGPQPSNNQGFRDVAASGKGLSGGRGVGRADNRQPRNPNSNPEEYFDEQQDSREDLSSETGYQQQRGLKFGLNKARYGQFDNDPQDIDQQLPSDRDRNINTPIPQERYRQTSLPPANIGKGQLTEESAIRHYKDRSYSLLEAYTSGYYSATPESVARNRSDWANPLDLVEFFDGLFWIIKASERNLLFPNPRMRIEQTRIRGIEYFFETNFTGEVYQSYTLEAPAHVELVNGKWVRIKKGQIRFL